MKSEILNKSDKIIHETEIVLTHKDKIFFTINYGDFSEAEQIKDIRSKTFDSPTVLYNNIKVPYEKTAKRFYLPINLNERPENFGKLSASDGYELFIENPPEVDELSDSVKNGTEYKLIAYNAEKYVEYKLVFTSFPIMSIELDKAPADKSNPIPETDTSAYVELFVPGSGEKNTASKVSSDALLRIRGGTSRNFIKKSYKLQFVNSEGKKTNRKLLDLRSDDDWILYAMYQEETKIRDRLAMDIWDEMSEGFIETPVSRVSRLRYIEVILNGQYWGMYGLMERIDAKQLGLEDENPLGKISAINGSEMPTTEQIKKAIELKQDYAKAIELKNPDIDSKNFAKAWEGLGEFINFAYYSSDDDFINTIDRYIDKDYFLLYWVYAQFECMGQFKNPYIWQGTNGKFYITPWDFDISLGLNWDGSAPLYHVHDKTTFTRNNQHIIGKRLIESDVNGSVEAVKRLYSDLRQDILSYDSLTERVEKLYSHIHDSGAYTRNLERWPDTGSTADNGHVGIEYLKEYFRERLKYLDSYIESLN